MTSATLTPPVLRDLHQLLAYHSRIGVDTYPNNSDSQRFLQSQIAPAPDAPGSPRARQTKAPVRDVPQKAPEVAYVPSATEAKDIAADINSCRGCQLFSQRMAAIIGKGGPQVRLMLVGGWVSSDGGDAKAGEVIFGSNEDVMLANMLSAMKLDADKAFVTNVIKCAIPKTSRPVADSIRSCVAYLHRQIELLAPEVICTMGITATRALLENQRPLSQVRGRFYPFVTASGKSIPLMPTYHPTFLLQNPEMKRATWADLQAIQRKLGLA